MKIVFLNNSFPVPTRTQKIYESIKRVHGGVELKIIAWDRLNYNKNMGNNNIYIFSSNEGYGNRFKKLYGMKKFSSYVNKVISSEKPDIIICRHWDMFFLASILFRKHRIIYDICDMPYVSNSLIYKVILKLESFFLNKRPSNLILASRFFEEKYSNIEGSKLVLENKIDLIKTTNNIVHKTSSKCDLSIAFIGAIRYFEVLKNLIDASIGLDVSLNFYGVGSDSERLKEYCRDKNNIHIYGRFDYSQIEEFYASNDVIWAAYPYKDNNVRKAISNKHFESLFFSKPCIYSINTELGEYCENNGIGFTVDPYSVENIKKLLIRLRDNKDFIKDNIINISEYKKDNSLLWNEYDKVIYEYIDSVYKQNI